MEKIVQYGRVRVGMWRNSTLKDIIIPERLC